VNIHTSLAPEKAANSLAISAGSRIPWKHCVKMDGMWLFRNRQLYIAWLEERNFSKSRINDAERIDKHCATSSFIGSTFAPDPAACVTELLKPAGVSGSNY